MDNLGKIENRKNISPDRDWTLADALLAAENDDRFAVLADGYRILVSILDSQAKELSQAKADLEVLKASEYCWTVREKQLLAEIARKDAFLMDIAKSCGIISLWAQKSIETIGPKAAQEEHNG
jgi:hypothetical protein